MKEEIENKASSREAPAAMNNADLFMMETPTFPQPIGQMPGSPMVYPPGFNVPDPRLIKQEPVESPQKKKRGRKKKEENQEKITDHMPTKKKKRDRFNGMSEDEVMKRELPDHLHENLDILIVGINPGLCAAYVGHHYAGPGNHFWKCLFLSGLIPEQLNAYDDYKLVKYGIGFTNIVARTTRGSADLTRKEIKEGATILSEKIMKYRPKIAVFNGKGIYEVFVGHKNFAFGKQPEPFAGTETLVYVMPSSSARCSQLPRAIDKVPFYTALKKLRDYLRGDLQKLDDSEVCFPDVELKVVKKEPKQEKVEEDSKNNPPLFGNNPGAIMTPPQMDQGNFAHASSQNICHPSNPNFMSIKQEPAFSPQEYGGSISGCAQNNFTASNISTPQMFNNQFSQSDFSPQQMSQQVMAHGNQQGPGFPGNFQSEAYSRQSDFHPSQMFTQSMALASQMAFSQGGSNFQMRGRYQMAMSSSWRGQVPIKQEPHDWSSNIPVYNPTMPQGNAAQTQSSNPLQMLENLSQGINTSGPPNCTGNTFTMSGSNIPSNSNCSQGVPNSFYGNQNYPQGNRLSQAPEHCGSSQMHHGNIPEEVPLHPSQSPIHIPDIIQDLPPSHGSDSPGARSTTHSLGSPPSQLPVVKSEPKDFATDTSCPFSK
ncbi:uncharacterized protein LOC125655075 isoform X3 [Ostrea edulis]|uniref:uncharacterized protein LOC125655075 isoform X3 n=1 Tax=Ostrea edulis TaxID=37623 RepID=UPI0024AFF0E4|nr:uncharacterized protein LOC125655075 isoform X3 [Ostrea edulis]